ncbi:hypothetical protein C8F04DRAFT_1199123 [Mycena alexandri]|uniref:Uncharacterized protein n=1 Tax=Mycena alexandri TaxID=1745969 RepID=A0AAD6S3K0_9AGAR|nr:hypothetical protein C8F04DRAFT_1199123 [Mycena alexandri]
MPEMPDNLMVIEGRQLHRGISTSDAPLTPVVRGVPAELQLSSKKLSSRKKWISTRASGKTNSEALLYMLRQFFGEPNYLKFRDDGFTSTPKDIVSEGRKVHQFELRWLELLTRPKSNTLNSPTSPIGFGSPGTFASRICVHSQIRDCVRARPVQKEAENTTSCTSVPEPGGLEVHDIRVCIRALRANLPASEAHLSRQSVALHTVGTVQHERCSCTQRTAQQWHPIILPAEARTDCRDTRIRSKGANGQSRHDNSKGRKRGSERRPEA